MKRKRTVVNKYITKKVDKDRREYEIKSKKAHLEVFLDTDSGFQGEFV